jgi:hypothetical protein
MFADYGSNKVNGFRVGADNPALGAHFADALASSGRNAIVIGTEAPGSKSGRAWPYWEKVAGKYRQIFDDIMGQLQTDLTQGFTVNRVQVAGHSAGGKAIGRAAAELGDLVTDVDAQDSGYGSSSAGAFGGSYVKLREWLLSGTAEHPRTLRVLTQNKPNDAARGQESAKDGVNERSFKKWLKANGKSQFTVSTTDLAEEKDKVTLEKKIVVQDASGATVANVFFLRLQTNHFGVRNLGVPDHLRTEAHDPGFGLRGYFLTP